MNHVWENPMKFKNKLKEILPFPLVSFISEILYGTFFKSIDNEWMLINIKRKMKQAAFEWPLPRTVLFYPKIPTSGFAIYKICRILNYKMICNKNQPCDLVIDWRCETRRSEDRVLEMINKKQSVVNYNCRDISKEKVEEVFQGVFVYGSAVDPLVYNGTCVVKSNNNATHDGRVIKCPIEKREEGSVYQKLINNQHDKDYIYDIRVPIIKEKIPCVYLKYRSIHDRFKHIIKTEVENPAKLFSQEEIEKIIVFAKALHLDYGELDVLRDHDNGLLYIIDANTTPYGPSKIKEFDKKFEALKTLSEAFDEMFFQTT
jgi:hypothetical protein